MLYFSIVYEVFFFKVAIWVSDPPSEVLASQSNLSKVYYYMTYLLNVLDLNRLDHPCGGFLSNGGNVNLSIYQVCIKLPSSSYNPNMNYVKFFLNRESKVLEYPLTLSITQTLEEGWIGGKLNNNTPISHGTKAMLLG